MIYRGTVKHGLVELENGAMLPEGTQVKVEPLTAQERQTPKRPGTSLANWAEENAEDWGDQFTSEDVEGFTGRRF